MEVGVVLFVILGVIVLLALFVLENCSLIRELDQRRKDHTEKNCNADHTLIHHMVFRNMMLHKRVQELEAELDKFNS